MVLSHAIAHVRHRHPIASLGRSAAFGCALTLAGADSFFHVMLKQAGARQPPRFLSSHPLTVQRIEALGTLAAQRGCRKTS